MVKRISSKLVEKIASEMELVSSDVDVYVDLETEQCIAVTRLDLEMLDDEMLDDTPEWQQTNVVLIKSILEDDGKRYLKLPDSFEINDYKLMTQFAESLSQKSIRSKLQRALDGAGAFQRFKSAIRDNDLEQDWYSFKARALHELALQWCKDNGLELAESAEAQEPLVEQKNIRFNS